MKGFKVTDKDMKCRDFQFELWSEFSVEGEIKACQNGFHFCEKLIDCFNYYDFNPENRVFEIEGSGDFDKKINKTAVRTIKFLRELTWMDVLSLVNTGENNTGRDNSGDNNSGNYNSGDHNSGNYNSGKYNSGHRNSGYRNSGYNNTGSYNSGCDNSGNLNSGYRNSGNYNTGKYNSGVYNSGNHNSGDFNSTNYSTGFFNRKEQTVFMFDKDTRLKRDDVNLPYIYLELNKWITPSEMTDKEKKENPNWETLRGYLKQIPYKEAWKKAWTNLDKKDKQKFLDLPNFDAEIFEEITGIKIK